VIAQLTGLVAQIGPTSAVIEVGGLGVQAVCSPSTVAGLQLGQQATLATSLIVREDSLTLYGFASTDEREFFELLLTATGVGPKLAQAVLMSCAMRLPQRIWCSCARCPAWVARVRNAS
jgi:Holliday junction DNA helicase RuvA